MCHQSPIGEYECLWKGSKSPLVHTLGVVQQWSTLPGMLKIDAQELFYFMVLPVGGTLIDGAGSLNTRLELYTDAHGTLIFDNYNECPPKNHERTEPIVGRHSTIGYNMKLQMYIYIIISILHTWWYVNMHRVMCCNPLKHKRRRKKGNWRWLTRMTITLDLDDDLGSTLFQSKANNWHLNFVNPTADSKNC